MLHCSIYLHAATVEHEEKSTAAKWIAARWDTVLLGVQQQERNHRLEWWSGEIRLVLYCSIYSGAATVEHEEKSAANHTAAKWDTLVLRVQQQERNQGLERWIEEMRSQVDEAGRNKLMRDLWARMMAPVAKLA